VTPAERLTGRRDAAAADLDRVLVEPPLGVRLFDEGELHGHVNSVPRGCDSEPVSETFAGKIALRKHELRKHEHLLGRRLGKGGMLAI